MKALKLFTKLVKDEQGGKVLEYALIAGLILLSRLLAFLPTCGDT